MQCGVLVALPLLPRLHWPHVFGHDEPSPFTRSENERPLRLTIDDDTIPESPALKVVLDLAAHEALEVTTTSSHGPAVLRLEDTVRDDQMGVQIMTPHGTSMKAVWPVSTWIKFAGDYARRHRRDRASEERRFLIAGSANGNVDALVLRDAQFDGAVAERANPMTVRQAAALIGLFLRSRGAREEFMSPGLRSNVAIGTQRFIVSRCVLNEGWRWWRACIGAGEETMRVGQGVQTRFERAMRARDEVMIECLQDTTGRGIDRDVLYHFDAMLLWLGGAIDTTALVATRAHSLDTPDHGVGWRRRRWREQLDSKAPHLHQMTEVGTPLRALMDLIACFRNTIHGEPVTGVTYSSAGSDRGLVQLPGGVEDEALSACEPLGGRALWGFVQEGVGPIGGLWDPYRFVQVLLPLAAASLNALMAATGVERLPGVDPTILIKQRPTAGFFEPDRVRRLMYLHGLTDPSL